MVPGLTEDPQQTFVGLIFEIEKGLADRPFQILLRKFLATFRILSNFFCQRATSSNFSEN